MGDSLDGVGEGLVNDGLVDGLVGGDGSGHRNGGVHGHVLEDGLGHVMGAHNRRGLVRGNGRGNVGVRRLSDGVRQRRDLGRHGGESVRLGGGVGEVAAEAVVLDGGGVVGGCADQVAGCGGQGQAGSGHNGAGPGEGEQGREEQEGLRKKNKI